jgi:peptidoglycan/LPS O-acetylase OafA/YrhL
MIFSKDWVERWHVHPYGKRDYDFIDGLRGIAILMVVACHVLYVNPSSSRSILFIGALFGSGALGVSLFFVLSGFLIALPFWSRLVSGEQNCTPRGYAGRRFWKIYPPMALSILILLPYYIFRIGDSEEYIMTAMQWWSGLPVVFPISSRINPVMWSLIIEVQFYITLPAFFLLIRQCGFNKAVWASILVFVIIPLSAWGIYSRFGIHTALHPVIRTNYPVGLMYFPLGVLFAALVASGRGSRGLARVGYLGILFLGITIYIQASASIHVMQIPEVLPTILMMTAGAMSLFFVFDQSKVGARLLCMPWLRWLGMLSYEWYLLHQPLFYLMWNGKSGGNVLKYLWITLGSAVGSLLLAAIMYRYFSLPILKLARGNAAERGV